MTELNDTLRANIMRARLEAEMKARDRKREQAHRGFLWGAWTSDRLACRDCGERLIEDDNRAAFLDPSEMFNTDTIAARANVAYDLLNRWSENLPAWIGPKTPLWRSKSVDREPHEIAMMATLDGPGGRSGKVRRFCDMSSHIFIRACPHCLGSDPLNLCPEFSDYGMAPVTPSHEFLSFLLDEQESRKNRARPQDEDRNRASPHDLLKEIEAAPMIKSSKHAHDECPACGSKTEHIWNFCKKCGYRLSA